MGNSRGRKFDVELFGEATVAVDHAEPCIPFVHGWTNDHASSRVNARRLCNATSAAALQRDIAESLTGQNVFSHGRGRGLVGRAEFFFLHWPWKSLRKHLQHIFVLVFGFSLLFLLFWICS